ncbi:nitrite reductase (NAD(P)H) large subunit, NirD [Novosphingobium nitrogenifigens DSM 19370]|uniref:Nitrite reductase (NAD(P)H) large subunit, NirD n=1 Tax=Novosphingobium nitrogenifigens DSM 19370 TaxID=983920 RepID=F1Z350_9SPHN|nr:nitrite reductase small subunit NirD [Novosphingobium nitrogenifigens]EGD60963.1 nitrite reductase (NAD(P)H) large subunit, NirD [Novosphingobium nitrogenifigens DSM 19370]
MIGEWLDIGPVGQIAPGTARTMPVVGGEEIAVFHTLDGEFHALVNKCPHKHGPLSEGIVHGSVVTCPLHSWNISLKTGEAQGDDKGCVPVIPMRVESGRLYLKRDVLLAAAKVGA